MEGLTGGSTYSLYEREGMKGELFQVKKEKIEKLTRKTETGIKKKKG